ncbi:MAG: YbjQ family protein [Firmicutes bacterium]|nr:YbjQ family protein [Bacillota bacterium]
MAGGSRSLGDVERYLAGVDWSGGAALTDLSAGDFWLLADRGFVPLGIVLGNSVFSMGVTGGLATGLRGLARGELVEFTQLMYDARRLALARMKAEADALGADAVVGVKITIVHHGDVMEVTAVGTGVKKVSEPQSSQAQVVLPVGGHQTAHVEGGPPLSR